MKPRLYMGLFALALISSVATATPVISSCPSNVGFDTYVALGAGGCVLDDKLFDNFLYSGSGSGGATPIPASGERSPRLTLPCFRDFSSRGLGLLAPARRWTPCSNLMSWCWREAPHHGHSRQHGRLSVCWRRDSRRAENISGTFAGNILLVDFSGGMVSTQTILVPSLGPLGLSTSQRIFR